jgi:hypothetical protein
MKNLIIKSTSTTPAVEFNIDGRLVLEGRSLPQNSNKFYLPLISWAAQLRNPQVKLDINLEYINSASVKKLLELMTILVTNTNIQNFIIEWHYEADDEDILESGKMFKDILKKAHFRFHKYSKAA